ncbi:MAG: hypothetical protein AAF708_23100, partial [Deinococcota bacterium]
MSAFWVSVVWLVGLTWLAGGLSWQKFIASRRTSDKKVSGESWQQALTVVQILSASCGLLILLTFIALPTVRLSSPISSSWGITNALYDSSVPLLAVTRLEPLLWLIVLAAIFVGAAVSLSQDRSHKGLTGFALLLGIASITGFVALAVWWQVVAQPVYLELADQGGAVWVVVILAALLRLLASYYKRHRVALRTLMLLLVGLIWLGLNVPAASRQLPLLSGYYTWLEPARPSVSVSVGIYANSLLTNAIVPTSFAYGSWLLVISLALLLVLAAATYHVAAGLKPMGLKQRQTHTNARVPKQLSDEHSSGQAKYGRSSRTSHQAQHPSVYVNIPLRASPSYLWRLATVVC